MSLSRQETEKTFSSADIRSFRHVQSHLSTCVGEAAQPDLRLRFHRRQCSHCRLFSRAGTGRLDWRPSCRRIEASAQGIRACGSRNHPLRPACALYHESGGSCLRRMVSRRRRKPVPDGRSASRSLLLHSASARHTHGSHGSACHSDGQEGSAETPALSTE